MLVRTMNRVTENVFISGISVVLDVRYRPSLTAAGITHILTVSASSIPPESCIPGIVYKFVMALDVIGQDLLGNNILEDALAFIEKATASGGKVLVHCEQGVSRSAAVIAAFLMRSNKWDVQKAMILVQKARPAAQPNHSFARQLNIFEDMNFVVDPMKLSSFPSYLRFCADYGIVPYSPAAAAANQASSSSDHNPKFKYRCRRCRRDLFYDTHVMHHTKGTVDLEEMDSTTLHVPHGESLPAGDQEREHTNVENICKFEFLLQPLKWMELDQYQGKLMCPHNCGEKLGQYVWGGLPCRGANGDACGRHITPWVHVQKGKVDECPTGTQIAALLQRVQVQATAPIPMSTLKAPKVVVVPATPTSL